MDYDVIIVGAGISGLYAAKLLKECGVNILVLEGRDRIAGRQWTYRSADIGFTDMGAAFIGKQQTKVLEVLKELGLETYAVRCDMRSTLSLKSTHLLYEAGIPSFKNILVLMDINNCIRLIDKLSLEVPLDAPWEAEKAEEWDSLTVKQFLERHLWTKEAKALAELAVLTLFGAQASQISLLFFLHEVRCTGGFVSLTSIVNGCQEMKIVGGSGQISERLASSLTGLVKLNHLVKKVTEIEAGVRVTTENGQSFTAKNVLLSVPVPGLFDIDFSPALPNYINQLSEVKPTCHMFKTFMFYERQFWRDHGLNGELVSETGIVTYALDDTKPDGSHPVILGFIDGDKAKKYSTFSSDERKTMICEQYASAFGVEAFLHPVKYVEMYWQKEDEQKFGRGSCVWTLPPGILTKVRKFVSPTQPFGNIFFTGTEAALTFKGYMDGALRSAHSAAAQISQSLGIELDYDESEFCCEVPYLPVSTVEKYLPSPPVFVVGVTIVISLLLLIVVLVLYFTLS